VQQWEFRLDDDARLAGEGDLGEETRDNRAHAETTVSDQGTPLIHGAHLAAAGGREMGAGRLYAADWAGAVKVDLRNL
jgi:hypothetical protein